MSFKVIDNFLDEDEFKILEKCICIEDIIPWQFFYPQVTCHEKIDTNLYEQKYGYTYFLLKGKEYKSKFYFLSLPILNKIHKNFQSEFKIYNIRINKSIYNNFNNSFKNDIPHVDVTEYEKNMYTCILYLNDSEGKTILFKNKLNGSINKNSMDEKLSIEEEISSKRNRLLIFDSNTIHTGSGFFTEYRYLININILTGKKLFL
jgi:hypothetical protein